MENVASLLFCINCQHETRPSGDYLCRAPANKLDSQINLVTGEEQVRWKASSCKDARANESFCGQAGRWFKQVDLSVVKSEFLNRPPTKKVSIRDITADDL